jgi:hypothetical protein
VEELFALRVLHDSAGFVVRLDDMRCSYQPIASASSWSEAMTRANVRVSSLSSSGGS